MVMLLSVAQKTIAMSEGSRVHVKAPSHHLSCESSATLKLFKQLTALLLTINCRKAWGKQPTGTEQKAPLTVWYEIHTSAQPIQQLNLISTSKKQSMGLCKGAFPLPILQKQHHP
jgi:hypothetical protein